MVHLGDIMDLGYEISSLPFCGQKRRYLLDSLQPAKRIAREDERVSFAAQGLSQHVRGVPGVHAGHTHALGRTGDNIQMVSGAAHNPLPYVVSALYCPAVPQQPTAPHPTVVIHAHSVQVCHPAAYAPHTSHQTQYSLPAHGLYTETSAAHTRSRAGPSQAAMHESARHTRQQSFESQSTYYQPSTQRMATAQSRHEQDVSEYWPAGAPDSQSSDPTQASLDGLSWLSFSGREEDVNQPAGYARERRQAGMTKNEVNSWRAAAVAATQEGWAGSDTYSPYRGEWAGVAGTSQYPEGNMGQTNTGGYISDRSHAGVRCGGLHTGSTDLDAVQACAAAVAARRLGVTVKLESSCSDMCPSLNGLRSRFSPAQHPLSVLPCSPVFTPEKRYEVFQDATQLRDLAVQNSSTVYARRTTKSMHDSCSSVEFAQVKAGEFVCHDVDRFQQVGDVAWQGVDEGRLNGRWQQSADDGLFQARGHTPDGRCECSYCGAQGRDAYNAVGVPAAKRVKQEQEQAERVQKEEDIAFRLGLSSSPGSLLRRTAQSRRDAQKAQQLAACDTDLYGLSAVFQSGRTPEGATCMHVNHSSVQHEPVTASDSRKRVMAQGAHRSQGSGNRGGQVAAQHGVYNKGQYLLPDHILPGSVLQCGTASRLAPTSTPDHTVGNGAGRDFVGSSLQVPLLHIADSWATRTHVQHTASTARHDKSQLAGSVESSHSARGSILSWLLPNEEPCSSGTSHLSSGHQLHGPQIGMLYQQLNRTATHLTHSRQHAHRMDGTDSITGKPTVQASSYPAEVSLRDIPYPHDSSAAPVSLGCREAAQQLRAAAPDVFDKQARYAATASNAFLPDRSQYSVVVDGSAGSYSASQLGYSQHLDAAQKKKATLAAVFPKAYVAQAPEIVSFVVPSHAQVHVGAERYVKLEGVGQTCRKPPIRPVYQKADDEVQAAVVKLRAVEKGSTAKGVASISYRAGPRASCGSKSQSFIDLYSMRLTKTPSIYQDLSCPAALEVANEIMMCMKLPGGIKYSSVSSSSPLFVLGVIHKFTAFDVALGSSYLQRIVMKKGIMERLLSIVVVPHLKALDAAAGYQQRQLVLPPQYQSQQSLLSVLQFVSLVLAAKVLGPRVDISREVLRVHISKSYSMPVSLSQALDVELLCLDALKWQLGPYIMEDQLDWLEALE